MAATNMDTLQAILHDVNARIEGLEQILLLRRDGTLVAEFQAAAASPSAKLILTEFAELTEDACQILEPDGPHTEAIMKGKHRFLALYRSDHIDVILGIIGQSTVNFGLLNSGCRTAIEKIEALGIA